MRATFNIVTLRSPRSIFPICERSMPAASASASWDRPMSFLIARIAPPRVFRSCSLSVCPDTLATDSQVAHRALFDHGIYDPLIGKY